MRVTEKKTVKIVRSCKRNPVYVSWINTLGGRDHWLFHTTQLDNITTSGDDTFEPYTEDLENSRGQLNDLSIFAQPSITCTAHVDVEDLEGIKTLFYSVNIEVLTNPDTWQVDGAKWETYRPQRGSWSFGETQQNKRLLEITFDKVYINNQTQ